MVTRIRPRVINLLVDDAAPSYSFDRAGRLVGAFVDGQTYHRGFDNRVLQKWSDPAGVRQRRWLPSAAARDLLEAAYTLARQVAGVVHDPRLSVLCGWDWPRLLADAAQFARIYRPVSILPPDQYLALVLQATEGCSYNRCTFCDFYRDRPFRIKSPAEFRTHLADVLAFMGPALTLRNSLFLADANALIAPMPRIHAWLDVLDAAEGLPSRDLYSFIDVFGAGRKSQADWAELAGRGLHRVYIGMETGDDALLRFLRKPGTAQDAVDAVTTLKAAGVAVSVIVMTGIGGARYAADHIEHTAAALNAMPLSVGDIVYFSPWIDQPGAEYAQLAAAAGLDDDAATIAMPLRADDQAAAMRAALHPWPAGRAPKCARYDIREFVY